VEGGARHCICHLPRYFKKPVHFLELAEAMVRTLSMCCCTHGPLPSLRCAVTLISTGGLKFDHGEGAVEANRLRVDSTMVGGGIQPGNGGFSGSSSLIWK